MVPDLTSVQRFTSRVADYVRYRPGYPPGLIPLAQTCFELSEGAVVADIGSGTGKLSAEFLRAGFEVLAVEPNEAMRNAAQDLTSWPLFHNLAGTAEALPLRDGSVALLVAGQAFHWFDQRESKREFKRVLRPGGGLMLIWNNRRTDSSAFLQEYEAMLQAHCPDYANVGNKHYDPKEIEAFFETRPEFACLRYEQRMDLKALRGRIFSSSYTPAEGSARRKLEDATQRLFAAHAVEDEVCVNYDTEIFYGKLT